MTTSLHLPVGTYGDVMAHLLPPGGKYEEAAFLFAMPHRIGHDLELRVIECAKLGADDFAARCSDYLELKDDVRARLIKRAHDLGASLVEMHSHVGPFRAAFSYSDINGLKDNVPHLWWRLKSRPYAAVVVARDGIDALVWVDEPENPVALYNIYDGEKVIRPQGTTWREWP